MAEVGFKEEADFARFLSMGAIGTEAVARDLRARGHRPVELERYAMSNKVWHTKVKRLRMPDLVCVQCGLRVESRAKSVLGIILSHSDQPGREWHAGGMRNTDLYAFLQVRIDEPTTVGAPFYVQRDALVATEEFSRQSGRKAVSEGSEVSLEWPSYVPNFDGKVVVAGDLIGADPTDSNLVTVTSLGTKKTYWYWRNWKQRRLHLAHGDPFIGGQTIVASVVDTPATVACPGQVLDPVVGMAAEDAVDRFVAVKAAGFLGRPDVADALQGIAHDTATDWRLRLEAMAALTRLGLTDYARAITDIALDDDQPDEARMEAVFVLSEIDGTAAVDALRHLAAQGLPSEVRSAAVWGLGQGVRCQPHAAAMFIADPDDYVALHALASIAAVDDALADQLRAQLEAEPRLAEASAALLLRHGRVLELVRATEGGYASRLLALRALGDVPPRVIAEAAGQASADALQPELAPMWRSQSDWIRQGGYEGLDSLATQSLRFGPEIG